MLIQTRILVVVVVVVVVVQNIKTVTLRGCGCYSCEPVQEPSDKFWQRCAH